jgi:hypothetical protein
MSNELATSSAVTCIIGQLSSMPDLSRLRPATLIWSAVLWKCSPRTAAVR